MNLNLQWNPRKTILALLSLLTVTFCGLQEAIAQKQRQHIVLNDSSYIDGYIKFNPSDPLSIRFKRKKNSPYLIYGVQHVSEFYTDHRLYLRKTLPSPTGSLPVFLEKLIYEHPEVSIFRSIGKSRVFFIETSDGIVQLDENFRETLAKGLNNPELAPLLEITNLSYNSLNYLLYVAASGKSLTYSKPFRLTPQLGVIFSSFDLQIPHQNQIVKISGTGSSLGLTLEFFPTYSRNLSFAVSPTVIYGSAEGFNSYREGSSSFDTDIYFNYSQAQIPLSARYYIDIRPNRWRPFLELGYAWSTLTSEKGQLDIAGYVGTSYSTDERDYDASSTYTGLVTGIGFEKYLKKTKAISAGVKVSAFRNDQSERLTSINPYLGFKF